jgi:hypothetical protein
MIVVCAEINKNHINVVHGRTKNFYVNPDGTCNNRWALNGGG